jgi:hypothetical protein
VVTYIFSQKVRAAVVILEETDVSGLKVQWPEGSTVIVFSTNR